MGEPFGWASWAPTSPSRRAPTTCRPGGRRGAPRNGRPRLSHPSSARPEQRPAMAPWSFAQQTAKSVRLVSASDRWCCRHAIRAAVLICLLNAGLFRPHTSPTCIACDKIGDKFYQDQWGQTICKTCPNGSKTYSGSNATAITSCECEAGASPFYPSPPSCFDSRSPQGRVLSVSGVSNG